MAKKKTTKQLTAEEIQEFKVLLLAKRKEILGDVSTIEKETLQKSRSDLSNMPIHMADVGSDNYEQEFTLELLDSERKVLVEIEDALKRIEEGTYGICEGTDKPIERSRLEAIPWARYSVEYANQKEKGVGKRGEAFKGAGGFPAGEGEEPEEQEEFEEPADDTKDQSEAM
jgi:RNA polymerase-binding protein DksA